MEFSKNDRKIKLLAIFSLIIAVVGLTLGFAAYSTSLKISSGASVLPNSDTFSVKFSTNKDRLAVDAIKSSSKTDGITVSDGVIDNSTNPSVKNLYVTFTAPSQYVEYTFYARNEGEYTAYLNDINFVGNKTCTAEIGTTDSFVQSACGYINMSVFVAGVEYTETTKLVNHTLEKGVGEEIKIRLSYGDNLLSGAGPFSIVFPNVELIYSS